MKRPILTLLAALGMSMAVAQTNTPTPGTTDNTNSNSLSTPGSITGRFNADYPNNNPTWTMDGPNYKAEYIDRTTNMGHHVTYDKSGNMVSREEQLTTSQYPSSIGDYYTQNYANDKYEVWASEDKSGNKTYYTNRNDETIWFDKNGKYKSKTKMKTKASKK